MDWDNDGLLVDAGQPVDGVLTTLDSRRAEFKSSPAALNNFIKSEFTRSFDSDYAGSTLPSAVIELNAKLLQSSDQRVVASRTFLVAKPAATTARACASWWTIAL